MKNFLNKAKAAVESVVEDVSNSDVMKKAGELVADAGDKISDVSSNVVQRVSGSDYERLRKAAEALYMAGHWKCDPPIEGEVLLWEELRDAAGIPKGTETRRKEMA